MSYDGFLDADLQEAQKQYANFLKLNETWQEWFDEEKVASLLEEFRNYPCVNDPTEGLLEQIMRDEEQYPELLIVVANRNSCQSAVTYQDLDHIEAAYRFRADGKERMLAYEVLPFDDGFDRDIVLAKYRQLGCDLSSGHDLRKCVFIPKTDHFRDEGNGFWSRPYFGKFDVLATAESQLYDY
ncbi:hypothetical protein AS026_26790 [Rhizobium altiplani]|uniref:Cytokinin glycosidase domain-containing protein n=2 Tax=Rhizobium/Agrobacterium group TaxID=227290 RepID=A0A109J0N7_9HYPH|nr:hypothetical protein [Rhizobium altiplani]KWV40169.1 hypothetical protein AS026_26790 [Rhizobium altiplani]